MVAECFYVLKYTAIKIEGYHFNLKVFNLNERKCRYT